MNAIRPQLPPGPSPHFHGRLCANELFLFFRLFLLFRPSPSSLQRPRNRPSEIRSSPIAPWRRFRAYLIPSPDFGLFPFRPPAFLSGGVRSAIFLSWGLTMDGRSAACCHVTIMFSNADI
ncbi:hypothetical protein P154DRAFT_363168 [Amniculicola lignicola CBS 123094]|uniref:Uncharacterized protein n=1 Tax=Amniculicola lignicola CBS 123094 TaxID=1392246 RepID=A0A6A5W6V1_9PLEO|nr:hypothetical protein P154DRAFT_363168 [Amniculicola lignicola CBS 123094]